MSTQSLARAAQLTLTSHTGKITLLITLTALSIVGRTAMAAIPNVQPSTVIIMLAALMFGARYGVLVAVATVLGSNLFIGHGPWSMMQIVAWGAVAVSAGLLRGCYKQLPYTLLAAIAALFGLVYGLIISLPMTAGGWHAFWLYYQAGLLFDMFHAMGNFALFLILAKPVWKLYYAASSDRGSLPG